MDTSTDWQSKIERKTTTSANSKNGNITLINSQSVLEVCGPDAEKFLQGQCSADITSLAEKNSLAGCICTVKGRVLCTFITTRIEDRILLKMSAELVTPMREYLGKYAAFFKVELIEWPVPSVLETFTPQSFKTATIPLTYSINEQEFTEHLIEPNSINLMIDELNNSDATLISEEDWSDKQIDCGWLNLTLDTTEKYLPHQLNLERLNAISFTKGCFTGQEIIARTEYRGKPKRRMHLIELEGLNLETFSLPIDMLDKDSGRTLGILLAVSDNQKKALAILPVDNQELSIATFEGIEIKLTPLEQPYPIENS